MFIWGFKKGFLEKEAFEQSLEVWPGINKRRDI